MEYIYSAMLLYSAGKEITESNIENVLKAAGIEPDITRIKALVASLEGVDIKSIVESVVTLPTTPAEKVKEPEKEEVEKKEEKEKEEEKEKKEEKVVTEEEAAAGLSALFG
jgi:large subunit ribosomal protein L12